MTTSSLRSSYATQTLPCGAAGTIGWRMLAAQGIELLMVWHERARQRRQLQSLNDQMLRDIGLARADVEAEAAKPFWRL